jgi:hypothetical protein
VGLEERRAAENVLDTGKAVLSTLEAVLFRLFAGSFTYLFANFGKELVATSGFRTQEQIDGVRARHQA